MLSLCSGYGGDSARGARSVRSGGFGLRWGVVVRVADRVLVDAARAGDVEAFEVLVRRHQGRVYRVALRLLGSDADAQDAAQETFIRAWRGLGRFRGESAVSTWLYRIVTNRCLNVIAARRPAESLDLGLERFGAVLDPFSQSHLGFRGEHHLAVHARCQTTGVALRHPSRPRSPHPRNVQGSPKSSIDIVLSGVFMLMTLLWLGAYCLIAARAAQTLQRPRMRAALDRITGSVLIALGLRLATEHG